MFRRSDAPCFGGMGMAVKDKRALRELSQTVSRGTASGIGVVLFGKATQEDEKAFASI